MCKNKSTVQNAFEMDLDFHFTVIFLVLIQHILPRCFLLSIYTVAYSVNKCNISVTGLIVSYTNSNHQDL